MARTSFPASVRAYLDAMRPYLAGGTIARKGRNLRVVYDDLRAIEAERHPDRHSPSRAKSPGAIAAADVGALLLRWKARGLDGATQKKYVTDLDGFLAWSGNPLIWNMRRTRHVRFPRAIDKPIRVLDADESERLRVAAESIDGWQGTVARFIVAFVPASGLRPKEFRLSRLVDLDLARGRILVAHPKGEGAWAAQDFAPVPRAVRSVVEDFLTERRTFLDGVECEWLVPYRRVSGAIGPWSEGLLRKLIGELERRSGVDFSLKTFRATFAQTAKDNGAPIEAVSRAMRHGSTKTTERFYARIRADDAFHEIEKAFDRPQVRVAPRE